MKELQGYDSGVDRVLPQLVPYDLEFSGLSDHRFPLSKWERSLPVASFDLTALEALIKHLGDSLGAPKARSDSEKNELDAWFAPRLHAALRIPRRIAGSREFWRWIGLDIGRPLVEARFGQNGAVRQWRYTGLHLRNAMSRLWWGAELIRNGASYREVPSVFSRTRTAQFALELGYSRYKPAAIAFVRVAEGLDGGPVLNDEQMKRLSRVVNALLSARVLESCDFGTPAPGLDEKWLSTSADAEALVNGDLPVGPDDGGIPEAAIETLATWFRALASTENVGSVTFRCCDSRERNAPAERGAPDAV